MKRKTHIVNPDIEEYLRGLTPSEDEVLRKMEELGMGSGFGYSASFVAKGISHNYNSN